MGNIEKKNFTCSVLIGALMLLGGLCRASENTIYVINNNSPHYSSGYGYGYGGTMCTEYGGICTNGHYIMSTARVRYAPPRWKRPTIRERRISEGKESMPYYYKQAYSR